MKVRIELGVMVVLLAMSQLVSAEPGQPLPALKVFAVPATTNVQVREPFRMALRVANPSPSNQVVRVMTCSWDEEWKSSNTNVMWNGWACAKNNLYVLVIPAGGVYTNELDMFVQSFTPDNELAFRMGFTSIGSTQTWWSGEIKLHVQPPDTWQHGGQVYRDRNHDGRIDWEMSGTASMVHLVFPPKVTLNNGMVVEIQEKSAQLVDTNKVDTNFDGFYDVAYGVSGTNSAIQWTKPIHERVPVVSEGLEPSEKQAWMDKVGR